LTPRFRLIAGPNGSGKTTLCDWLARAFAVNFYTMVNADDLFVRASSVRAIPAPMPIDGAEWRRHLAASTYPASVTRFFRRDIRLVDDCFRFKTAASVNTYTVSLVANFFQDRLIESGQSFSQETVFSHPSKVDALRRARAQGFRTYLYFISTDSPLINSFRVRSRVRKGGHDVPAEKIASRFDRSLRQIEPALPFLSRAFFFDNSGPCIRHLASYSEADGFSLAVPARSLPAWFRTHVPFNAK